MKTITSVACCTILMCGAWPVLAQETKAQRPSTDRSAASQLDGKTHGSNVRASQLMGMNIQNATGKSVGEINDLVIDANTGKIRYAAVTYGGFLGIGNKMFAVPFEAFKCHPARNAPDQTVLMLDVSQEKLEGAVGFDESSWPDFADQKFTMDLDRRYGVDRRMRDREGKVDVRVNRDGVDVDVDGNRDDK